MITLLFWVVYAAGFVFTYRKMYLAFARADVIGGDDGVDRAMCALLSMVCSTMWPLAIAGYGVWRVATPMTPEERKAELDKRQREIERMERELGIKP